MSLELTVASAVAIASIWAFCTTPLAARLATRYGFFDLPAGYKGHAQPTPYLGGLAVVAGLIVAMLVAAGEPRRTVPLVIGVAVLWVVGTVDDRRHVSPGLRIAVELGLSTGLWGLGLGWQLGLGSGLDLVLTCLWIVAVVNAFNLFDNMDGASSSMALVVAVGATVLGIVHSDTWVAGTGAALAGSCLGFLPYNLARPHARIFLGDGGSMPLGFGVAAVVMIGASEAAAEWQSLVIGLMLVGIPAVDTALVVISRTRKGISILTGGRDHLTHRTRRRLRSAHAVAAALGGLQAVVSALALVAVRRGSGTVLVAVLAFLAVAGAAIVVLEAEEDRFTMRTGAVAMARRRPSQRQPWASPAYALLTALGLGAAVSPFFFGFYSSGVWIPMGLGVITLAVVGMIGRPPRLSTSGFAVLGGLVGLAIWSSASSVWAESADQAWTGGNRLVVLAAVLGLALVLVRNELRSAWLVGALATGTLAVAAWVVVKMVSADGSIFLGGRLQDPLGYINAEATVFAMGAWMCVAASERRRAALAGAGLGGAVLLSCLVLLSQSRGAALAVLVSTVLVVALLPGRRRRIFALATVAAALVVASGALLRVYSTAGEEGAIRTAGLTTVAVAVIAGALWGCVVAAHNRVLATRPGLAPRLDRAARSALISGGVAALIVALVLSGRIVGVVERQYEAFVALPQQGQTAVSTESTSSRLFSGAGTRSEFWRVALRGWEEAPLVGVGAGNYDRVWFAQRRTREDIRQPHSLELQTLSEGGLVGIVLLAVFAGGLGLGGWRLRRTAARSPLESTAAVAALGGTSVWFIHTSVDWMHLLPGVTAVALCLMAILVRWRPSEDVRRPQTARYRRFVLQSRPAKVLAAGGLAVLVVLGGASLSRQGLALFYREHAQSALAKNPAKALRDADRSLRLDDEAVPSYQLRAAALARFDRGPEAQQALLAATRKEPSDFVT